MRIKGRAFKFPTPKLSYKILFPYAIHPQPRILINLSVRFIYKYEVAFALDFRILYI